MESVLTPMTVKMVARSFTLSSGCAGITAAMAIAADAPQIPTAPPVRTPNLFRYPSIFASTTPKPMVSATESTTIAIGIGPNSVICASVIRTPRSATPMRSSGLAEN